MQPLNPFLAAFFKSSVASQCTPVHHYILLVPLTDVLLTSRETETGAPSSEVIASEDFLASHVLRVPPPGSGPGAKDGVPNLREVRGKAKQVSTLNGRSVVIKDSTVYSNKGFKSLAQAQVLSDNTFYPDAFEARQWLIYYISKPLVGTWEEVRLTPAVLIPGVRKRKMVEQQRASKAASASDADLPKKKDIQSFHDLLNNFPMIARQMHAGLERLFLEFNNVFQKPLPPPPSATEIPDPLPDGPIASAMRRARSSSLSRYGEQGVQHLPVTDDFYAEDDEDIMRASLESAVTTAIDIFQGVDRQQLSLLGATTDLTGPLVEKLIERYVTENVHRLLFPRLNAMKRPEDIDLEKKIHQMEYIDISQLGIAIDGGQKGKHDLIIQIDPAIEEFRKIATALSPQEMMDLLLSTIKRVSHLTEPVLAGGPAELHSEKTMMTVNADTLVSLLLYVVIRSQVRHLNARLSYIRSFIFIDDVDSGELGYALSTFEAVLTYLSMDSSGLRRASRRNKALWNSAKKGDMETLRSILEPSSAADGAGQDSPDSPRSRRNSATWSASNGEGKSRRSSWTFTLSERFSHGSGLSHVFPFQSDGYHDDNGSTAAPKKIKRVAMDTRSLSSGSEISFQSHTASVASIGSAQEGDISAERLSQTNNAFGESVPMMAIQNKQPEVLRYLLSLSEHYPLPTVLDDMNNENTTLLSAAVQLGHAELIDIVWGFVTTKSSDAEIVDYVARQDIWGRSIGHYLFHAPFLIEQIGHIIPWRQRDKNGQTPLFALCRSYDHGNYHDMVEAALEAARRAQRDGEPLHVDEHVDNKSNTLLHIINDAQLALTILQRCDVDVNATNERRFTPLMVASKYGRYDMVRALFADPRVDVGAKELRGLTAVELAKDDEVRNRIDDLGLFSMVPGRDGRITGVVRAFFVEDGSVRLVLKSAAPTDRESYTVTTSRRSLTDFEQLMQLLGEEHPASWLPPMSDTRSPFQIPSKPSRAILRDIQAKTDSALKVMLGHPTFATHEMLWEFFLVPELQLDTMRERSKLKAEARVERVRDEYEPITEVREVEQFVNHARDMVRSVSHSTKSVTRRANSTGVAAADMYDSSVLLHRAVTTLPFLPNRYVDAFETYVRALTPTQSSPEMTLHTSLLGVQSTVQGLLSALSRPLTLVGQIQSARREAERSQSSTSRSSRWPLGLLDDTRQRMQDEKEKRARRIGEEAGYYARELRYTQQTVASELAGWQDMHDRMGRRLIADYARGMLVQERNKLDGMMRALRKVRGVAEEGRQRHWGPLPRSPPGLRMQDREMAEAGQGPVDEASGGGERV
ncbi:Vacuolar sorting protein 9 (VPS9) domain [Geosmithia morbida]|uniref:Vacuolar sorting protein 9 (VPS9) domain n=1 Tax=Geosmithia morbida TaxID=1094350 RepID=A0A9P4YV40_9HYPO|nr:Vacuolar sorting protein 9 (VPS9) domain [Geosmithia morbida]KAF4122349.1 Vacuolar sorting protein 9 (VPS9) domain [Geosmithia morbida]